MSSRYTFAAALAYIRRPYFPAGRDRVGAVQLKHLVQLLFFAMAMAIVVGGLIGGLIANVSGELPENVNETLGQTDPARLLLIGVIIAPIMEEVIFRSWLGGRRTCILCLPVLAGVFAVLAGIGAAISPMIIGIIIVILTFMVLGLAQRLSAMEPHAQKAARWSLFPIAFYGSALMFAMSHLANYEGGLSSPLMLLAVLPQALVGLILGYVRMRFALGAAIIFHAAYNLILISVFMSAQSLATTADPTTMIAHPLALTLAAFGAAP